MDEGLEVQGQLTIELGLCVYKRDTHILQKIFILAFCFVILFRESIKIISVLQI